MSGRMSRVTIVKIDRNSVRIGIEAPDEVLGPARGDRLRGARSLDSFCEAGAA